MADLGVPRPYRAPLAELARFDEDVSTQLVEGLEALPPYAAVTDIQRALGEIVGDEEGVLAAALLSLRGLLRMSNPGEIGASLAKSSDLDLNSDEREALRERVAALLQTAAMSTTAVAVDLQTQHERNFQSARVFTDLRPVFPDEVDEGPTGAVVIEMLQLQTWNRSGDTETFFVALDEKDLLELQGVIDRALKKTAALRRFLDDKGLSYFQLEEEE